MKIAQKGCHMCANAEWDADGCTCGVTGTFIGNTDIPICEIEVNDNAMREAETVPVVTEQAEPECSDAINPSHYKQGGIECIEALKAATVNLKGIEAVCTANAIKYLWRWKEKNGITDIKKCIWYCERLLKEVEQNDEC